MQVVLISGLSGSGKSIALNVLEDSGYYCVDNLPAPLLSDLIGHLRLEGHERVAVAVDMRGGSSIAALPPQLRKLESDEVALRFVFLDARNEVLIQRFSETRRRHPLAEGDVTLDEAIVRERDALEMLASLGHHIDTSNLRPNACAPASRISSRSVEGSGLTLLFESFGFKHGIPLDADLVFDVRCLPNPHYDPKLRPLTGRDEEVIRFLEAQPEVAQDGVRPAPLHRRLAAGLCARQPLLPDGWHRLHRRAASFGVSRRKAGRALSGPRRACWCGTAA
jgi:UPF0042 nucleotide-binding protein